MTREELFQLHLDTTAKCLAIMKKKNADYSGGGGPFENFIAGEVIGVDAELGILMRSLDKFQRIRSFVHNGELQVKEESVDDAIEDVINYMILLKGLIKHKTAETTTAVAEPRTLVPEPDLSEAVKNQWSRALLKEFETRKAKPLDFNTLVGDAQALVKTANYMYGDLDGKIDRDDLYLAKHQAS